MSRSAQPRIGGTAKGRVALTGNQLQLVIAAAHKALTASDIEIGPSRVARIVRRFSKALARSHTTFDEFITAEGFQRRLKWEDPELACVFAYLMDPVGESAVNHVMKERGW
jgi:hypothetical protein